MHDLIPVAKLIWKCAGSLAQLGGAQRWGMPREWGRQFIRLACLLAAFAWLVTACSNLPFNRQSSPPRPPVPNLYHIVQRGQTLFEIAALYEVPLKQLRKANRIGAAGKIMIGQRVLIPGEGRLATLPLPPDSVPRKHKPSVRKPRGGTRAGNRKGTTRTGRRSGGQPAAHYTFIWPVRGKVVATFGSTKGGRNDGIDITARSGSDIVAASAGRVIFSDWGPQSFGKLVVIKHNSDFITVYAHNAVNYVSKNDLVQQGQAIARIGSVGVHKRPMLHFEVRRKRRPRNPLKYLPK